MKRILCLWLPNWPIQRLVVARPELERRPIVLHLRDPRRGQCVAACSSAARRQGVRIGMPLAEATALLQNHVGHNNHNPKRKRGSHLSLANASGFNIDSYDPTGDLENLRQLAEWCERFSPIVGIEHCQPRIAECGLHKGAREPESLLLDVTGIGAVFGNESTLAERVAKEFREQGYFVHIAIADTIGAAWAAAHFGCRSSHGDIIIIPAGEPMAALASLPVLALRLPIEISETLHQLGIENIGQLLTLPRTSLLSRFGDDLLVRLDQASGQVDELINALHPLPEFEVEHQFEHPTDQRDTIELVLKQLLKRVGCLLINQGQGVLQLECHFDVGQASSLAPIPAVTSGTLVLRRKRN